MPVTIGAKASPKHGTPGRVNLLASKQARTTATGKAIPPLPSQPAYAATEEQQHGVNFAPGYTTDTPLNNLTAGSLMELIGPAISQTVQQATATICQHIEHHEVRINSHEQRLPP